MRIIFLWFSALYGQNSGAKVNTINQEQTIKEKPKKLYPEFNVLIGLNIFSSGYNYAKPSASWSLPPERVSELIPPYKAYSINGFGTVFNVNWFFFKYVGLIFAIDHIPSSLILYDSNHNLEHYSLFNIYAAYIGLQTRYLLGDHVIFGKVLTDEEKLTNHYQYCCSIFAEFKMGANYLAYDSEYIHLLKRLHGANVPVIGPEDSPFGLAYKVRFGATFYFPQILLEMSIDSVHYEVTSKGIRNGLGGGLGGSFSLGFYL